MSEKVRRQGTSEFPMHPILDELKPSDYADKENPITIGYGGSGGSGTCVTIDKGHLGDDKSVSVTSYKVNGKTVVTAVGFNEPHIPIEEAVEVSRPDEMLVDMVAKTAYEAYGRSANWLNAFGNKMPMWEMLPQQIKTNWYMAVTAVIALGPKMLGGQ